MLDTWVDFSFIQSFNIVPKEWKILWDIVLYSGVGISWVYEEPNKWIKRAEAHTQVI